MSKKLELPQTINKLKVLLQYVLNTDKSSVSPILIKVERRNQAFHNLKR